MKKIPRGLYYWGPPIVWMLVIFTFSSISDSELPEYGALDFAVKKSAHLAEFALLAALFCRALAAGRPPEARTVWITLGLTVLYAVSDEAHQLFIAGRHGRPVDVLIDLAGACAGLVGWLRWSAAARRRLQTVTRAPGAGME